MSVRVVVSCDGTWAGGMPCRGALPVDAHYVPQAQYAARQQGWVSGWDGGPLDLCPAHAAQRAEQ